MADVFLSYDRKDVLLAERLASLMESAGLSVWWDRILRAGESFEDVIERELTRANRIVVLWSKASVSSRWVREEAREGLVRGVLLPFRVADVNLPLAFRGVHTLDLSEWVQYAQDTLPVELSRELGISEQPQRQMGFEYQLDITFCVDLNASMEPHLKELKRSMLHFHTDLYELGLSVSKRFASQSSRLIAFSSSKGPFLASSFVPIPSDEDYFIYLVTSLRVEPVSEPDRQSMSLKALEIAIRARWPALSESAGQRRQIIVVWSDHQAAAGPVGAFGASDLDELSDHWHGDNLS